MIAECTITIVEIAFMIMASAIIVVEGGFFINVSMFIIMEGVLITIIGHDSCECVL